MPETPKDHFVDWRTCAGRCWCSATEMIAPEQPTPATQAAEIERLRAREKDADRYEEIVADAANLLGCGYKDIHDRLVRVLVRSSHVKGAALRVRSMAAELEQLSAKLESADLIAPAPTQHEPRTEPPTQPREDGGERVPPLDAAPPDESMATTALDRSSYEECQRQGAWAYTFGKSLADNPYVNVSADAAHWEFGWRDAAVDDEG